MNPLTKLKFEARKKAREAVKKMKPKFQTDSENNLIIIPAYNEERNIGRTIDLIQKNWSECKNFSGR